MASKLVLVLAFFCCLPASCFGVYSLYGDSQRHNVQEFHGMNEFSAEIYGSDYGHFVEFYYDWCGHCQFFAPRWKTLSNSLKPWRNVVRLGSVNCNEPENYGLCQSQNIQIVPTLKYFKYNSGGNIVYYFMEESDFDNLEKLTNDFGNIIYNDYIQQRPPEWPSLELIQDYTPIDQVPMPQVDYVVAVFEDPSQITLSTQAILDLSSMPNVKVIAGSWNHATAKDYRSRSYEFPLVLVYRYPDLANPMTAYRTPPNRKTLLSHVEYWTNTKPASSGSGSASRRLLLR